MANELAVIGKPIGAPERKRVRIATIDINDACPSKCVFCYNFLNLKAMHVLPFSVFKDAVDKMPNLQRINIGGGEPFLHKELPVMLEYKLQKGVSTDISTSGIVYSEEVAGLAQKYGRLLGIQVNVPAGDAQSFGAITGHESNFAKLLSNLEKFAAWSAHSSARIRFTICQENASGLAQVAEIASSFNLPLYVQLYLPITGSQAHVLDDAGLEAVKFWIAAMKTSGRSIHIDDYRAGKTGCSALALAYSIPLQDGLCPAIRGERIYIDAGGNAKGCELHV